MDDRGKEDEGNIGEWVGVNGRRWERREGEKRRQGEAPNWCTGYILIVISGSGYLAKEDIISYKLRFD